MRSFTVSTSVDLPPAAVLDLLADLPRHRGLHPFLVSATPLDRGEDWCEWEVVERPSIGPLRYTVRFRARLERPAEDTLLSRVWLPPRVRLDSRTETVDLPTGGACVTEVTTVRAPRALEGYVARQAERAHRRVFERLPGPVQG